MPAKIKNLTSINNATCATGGDGIVGDWSRAELEGHVRDEYHLHLAAGADDRPGPASAWKMRPTPKLASSPATDSGRSRRLTSSRSAARLEGRRPGLMTPLAEQEAWTR